MVITRLRRLLAVAVGALFVCNLTQATSALTPGAAPQDSLAQAKTLYAAASYEEALAILDKLNASSAQDVMAIAEYRIFCLLALGRTDEANRAIETVLRTNPFYKGSEAQVSPRIQGIIKDARRQLLPSIVLKSYADAKAAFDRKDPTAGDQFDNVLKLLEDPDTKNVASLADLRTVAAGFRDLAKAAAAPPPPPPAPAVVETAPPAAPPSTPTPAAPARSIYTLIDKDVVAPVAVNRHIPVWNPRVNEDRRTFNGVLRIIIDEAGNVAVADMRASAHPVYDTALLEAARSWTFKPAIRGGLPVPYEMLIDIALTPPQR
jgi:TonB family protein